ncbi:15608_t:CDS:1, partial [Dentiscutata heterogama]
EYKNLIDENKYSTNAEVTEILKILVATNSNSLYIVKQKS